MAPRVLAVRQPATPGYPTSQLAERTPSMLRSSPRPARLPALLLSLSAGALAGCAGDGAVVDDEGWRPGGKGDENGVTLRYKSYDVLFTNPVCREYRYAAPIPTADGAGEIEAKPKNVYCTYDDTAASAARPASPQFRLVEWITPLGDGDEIFLAYLSFSNAAVSDALCAAAERGAEVTFVLDSRSTQADRLEGCGATILLRGHAGSIGYAHNKVILINPRGDGEYMQMTFSSGNMSSGVVTHHENWHFLEVARDSYFAQAHLCLMDAQVDETASSGRTEYRAALNACRDRIEPLEEDDIKAFFIPNRDDSKRATRYLLGAIDDAAAIDLGAHRFGHPDLVDGLEQRLADGGDFTLRMVADDDLYWLDPVAGPSLTTGDNQPFEADNVAALERAGTDRFEIRYLETNHGAHLLHHNKFLIYRDGAGAPFGVLAGAANLTRSGFNDNFENIYFIKVPHVLAQFDTQFERFWGTPAEGDVEAPPIATPRERMPARDEAPQ
jgi:phosphatidylserine/phosphatidylglycerophosphate/cardiolipin synthase-like enzyme